MTRVNGNAKSSWPLDIEPPLPHHVEAERSILGAILLDNHALNAAIEKLKPMDFFHDDHRRIYQQMIALGKAQQPIDLVTLTEQLQRSGALESVGGAAYVAQLMDGMPRITNVEHYARIVKEKAFLRGLIHATSAIQQQALEAAEDADLILDRAEKALSDIKAGRTTEWQKKFHTVDELPKGEPIMLIDDVLPEGVTFVGATTGHGKTWFALSLSKALTQGGKLLGVFNVAEIVPVLYLVPEMNGRTFRRRCERFGIEGQHFRCMTISDGVPCDLSDRVLQAAVRELKPVIVLDTAIRFSTGENENSASEVSQNLAKAIFGLIHLGARAVICLHHRSKDSARSDVMTVENCLRGSGDLAAIADAVWGLQHDRGGGSAAYLKESRRLVRLNVRCVKARDFRPPEDFRIQLDPYIDQVQDMAVLTGESPTLETDAERVCQVIEADTRASLRQIEKRSGIRKDRVKRLASGRGWVQNGHVWEKRAIT